MHSTISQLIITAASTFTILLVIHKADCFIADAHGLMQTKTLKDSSSYGGNAAAGTCAPVLHGALIHTVQDQKHTLRFPMLFA